MRARGGFVFLTAVIDINFLYAYSAPADRVSADPVPLVARPFPLRFNGSATGASCTGLEGYTRSRPRASPDRRGNTRVYARARARTHNEKPDGRPLLAKQLRLVTIATCPVVQGLVVVVVVVVAHVYTQIKRHNIQSSTAVAVVP